jgi:hypothetical protein
MLGKPVFFDPTGKRARLLRAVAWVAGTLSTIVIVLFAAILVVVHRPEDKSFDRQLSAHTSIRCAWAPTCSPAHAITNSNAANPELLKTASKLASDLRERERALRTRHPQAEVVDRHPVPAPLRGSKERSLSIGFYVNWDDNSYPALKQALPHLDWVIPSWISLQGANLKLKAEVDDRVLKLIQETKPNVPILPMIQNAVEVKWDGPGLARLLADPAARTARIDDIVSFLQSNKFQGLTVDFEELPPRAKGSAGLSLRAFQRPHVARDGDGSRRPLRRRQLALRDLCADCRLHAAHGLRPALRSKRAGKHRWPRLVRDHPRQAHAGTRPGPHHRGHRRIRL